MWQNKLNIGITGGTGFIGSRLVKLLSESGHQVRVLSRNTKKNTHGIIFFTGDLRQPNEIKMDFFNGLDVLIHCAGVIDSHSEMNIVNIEGTIKIYELACIYGVRRFVNLSSIGVYKKINDIVIDEFSALLPDNLYESTKMAADEFLLKNSSEIKELIILRPSTVYGVGMKNQSLYKMIKSIYLNYFFYIGSADSTLNIIHVDDVVHALKLCATRQVIPEKIYNLSACCTVKEFFGVVAKRLNIKARFIIRLPFWLARLIAKIGTLLFPNFPLTRSRVIALSSNMVYSSDLIKRDLGMASVTNNEQGVGELAFFWLTNYKK